MTGDCRPSTTSSSSNGSRGSGVTDIVLTADRRIRARLAPIHVVGTRRKVAAFDAVDRRDEAILGVAKYAIAIARGKQLNHASRSLESDVRGLARRPASAEMAIQALLCAEGVNGKLQGA